MALYGLGFELAVIESLKQLCDQEEKAVSITEIKTHFLEANNLTLSKRYQKTLRIRIWRSLIKWQDLEYCSLDCRKHPTKNILINYYKYNLENGELT